MVTSGWLVELLSVKDELKCATNISGQQSVTEDGTTMTLVSCVDNLAFHCRVINLVNK